MTVIGEFVIDNNPQMEIEENPLIDLRSYPVNNVLDILLQDKTTKKNIIWATDAYQSHGKNCTDTSRITREAFSMEKKVALQPRTEKALEQQQERTRKKAEVFTPVWLCNKMNNYADEEWFGRKDVFNHENNDNSWAVIEEKIQFPDGKTWKDYVDSRRLEITCGEAPYLVSRYDAATGMFILPPLRRVGILDRKLRIVNENAESKEEWIKWTERAFQSCYGYEWQGDSLLIARINLLMSFLDYYTEKWDENPDDETLKRIANTIAWNLWQMDGLKDTVPFGKPYQQFRQVTLFDSFEKLEKPKEDVALPCKIYDWRRDNSLLFKDCKKRGKMSKKLFDFVIGNPPYQQEFSDEGNKTYAAPVYHDFMDAAYKVGDAVELIHPARFLFNAGSTPKEWNQKMLNDVHFKVLRYDEDATVVFPGVEIKGGVSITYHDDSKNYGPITIFTKYPELNNILHKISSSERITSIIFIQNRFDLSKLLSDYPQYKPNIGSDGKDSRFEKNIFVKIPLFQDNPIDGGIRTIGIMQNKRCWKYIDKQYVDQKHENLYHYKVLLPVANGNGKFGEPLGTPLIAKPEEAYTRSFIGFGAFDSTEDAENVLKYLKTKFARALLSVLKVTQMANKDVWECVPLQDFSKSSPIDWSKSVPEIDKQLYAKYNLSSEEISFIESNVQEMK